MTEQEIELIDNYRQLDEAGKQMLMEHLRKLQVRGSDEHGTPLDPNHPWNREQ